MHTVNSNRSYTKGTGYFLCFYPETNSLDSILSSFFDIIFLIMVSELMIVVRRLQSDKTKYVIVISDIHANLKTDQANKVYALKKGEVKC